MIAVLGLIGLVCFMVFALCLAVGTVAGSSIGALGSVGRGGQRPPRTSYWSIR
jgi:Na+/H+ antiporter NhaC